jgi:hypothetical protein
MEQHYGRLMFRHFNAGTDVGFVTELPKHLKPLATEICDFVTFGLSFRAFRRDYNTP